MRTNEDRLTEYLSVIGRLAIGFSGGVDSTYLLQTAADELGRENVLAVTARSSAFPARENREAEEFCRDRGIKQVVMEFDQMGVEGFADNPPNRCYLCKRALFGRMKEVACAEGFSSVAEGSNMDDMGDYRPGLLAIEELGILSPLRHAGMSREEIRHFSRKRGLPTWEKPSFACLATRFVYGEKITEQRLSLVDQGEQLLMDMGFSQIRVRVHGEGEHPMARIEVPADRLQQFLEEEVRKKAAAAFEQIGFSHVALDLKGYRTGSMNPRDPESGIASASSGISGGSCG